MAKHTHNYQLVRTETKIVKGKTITYKFFECVNPGCPNPDTMAVER